MSEASVVTIDGTSGIYQRLASAFAVRTNGGVTGVDLQVDDGWLLR